MKKRLKDNIMLIILCIVIICCTISINDSLYSIENEIDGKVGYMAITTDSISWKLDNISSQTNNLSNMEERLHKIYNEF